jgi:hypothetical protein
MKRWTAWLAGLLLVCAVGRAQTRFPTEARSAGVEKEPHIRSVAQDASGFIWGVSREIAGEIFRRSDGGWERHAVADLESQRPQAIEARRDGTIVCLWLSTDGTGGAFSLHRTAEAAKVIAFDGKLLEPRLLLRADGSALVTERGPTIVDLAAAAATAQVRKLPDELFRPATRGEAQERNYAATRAVEDEAGRLWLWSYALDTSDYQWRLAELVLRRDDGGFERFPTAGLSSGEKISAVLPAAPDELWIAKVGEGLWSVDTKGKQATPLPGGSFVPVTRAAFAYVEEMRAFGRARYVVTCPRPSQFEAADNAAPRIAGRISIGMRHFYDQAQRTGTLFRYRDGKWQELLEKLDEYPRFGGWDRPWLLDKNELDPGQDILYLGAVGSGPWVIPATAGLSPTLLDWRQLFPLPEARDFCLLPNRERLLCVSENGETALVSAKPVSPKGVRTIGRIKTWQRLWRDARGHLWACADSLMEWDGRRWIAHARPAETAGEALLDWLADDRDRGWIFFGSGRVAICSFGNAQWQSFGSVESALQAQLPAGVRLPNLDNPFLAPVFSGDGRCAIFRLPDRWSYFDGAAWRHWKTREIAGDEKAQVEGGPFFDETRQLCFPLGGQTRQWDIAAKKWNAFAAPLGPEPSTRPIEPAAELSDPSPIKDPLSVARDTDGIAWIVTRDGQLKKLAPGLMVSAFFEGEPHPFREGMKVARALVDARGGAWLEISEFGAYRHYIFIGSLGQPETKAELLRLEGDTATLRFTMPIGDVPKRKGATPPALFSWQLDGGPWQRLSEQPDLSLKQLAPGRHRLLVRSFGPALNVDPTPAVVEWETRIDPGQQHRALLAELSAPNLARREAAAKAFREQGAFAAPFLKAARATVPEETRWWIDAILQQLPKARREE